MGPLLVVDGGLESLDRAESALKTYARAYARNPTRAQSKRLHEAARRYAQECDDMNERIRRG